MSGASVGFFRPRTQNAEQSTLINPPLQSGFCGYRSKREEPDPYLVKVDAEGVCVSMRIHISG